MTRGSRLPGVEPAADAVDPIVLHVDADCFYAACERLREPALRGEPLVVGMGYEDGDDTGAVATASYEAREYGVESAMAISQALEALPRRADAREAGESVEDTGYYRPVDMEYYESVSESVREILHDAADVVREVSIDEAYLDVTDRTGWSVAEGFARHVKERIRQEVGITVSIGVASTMSAAKIASDFEKPDGLTVVEPDEVRSFLAPLDVSKIHGVGPVTAGALREMGLETAGDVAEADVDSLVDQFGERGREFYRYARGDDDRRVSPRGLPKSFSRESAFGDPVTDWDRKRERLEALASAVAERATREGALYRTVGVKAVTPPYEVNTRERSLPGPVDDPELVIEIAIDLFGEFEDARVRKLGVRLANLDFEAADQTDLDGWESGDERIPDPEFGGSGDTGSAVRSEERASTEGGQLDLSELDSRATDRSTVTESESASSTSPDPAGGTPTIEEWLPNNEGESSDGRVETTSVSTAADSSPSNGHPKRSSSTDRRGTNGHDLSEWSTADRRSTDDDRAGDAGGEDGSESTGDGTNSPGPPDGFVGQTTLSQYR